MNLGLYDDRLLLEYLWYIRPRCKIECLMQSSEQASDWRNILRIRVLAKYIYDLNSNCIWSQKLDWRIVLTSCWQPSPQRLIDVWRLKQVFWISKICGPTYVIIRH